MILATAMKPKPLIPRWSAMRKTPTRTWRKKAKMVPNRRKKRIEEKTMFKWTGKRKSSRNNNHRTYRSSSSNNNMNNNSSSSRNRRINN